MESLESAGGGSWKAGWPALVWTVAGSPDAPPERTGLDWMLSLLAAPLSSPLRGSGMDSSCTPVHSRMGQLNVCNIWVSRSPSVPAVNPNPQNCIFMSRFEPHSRCSCGPPQTPQRQQVLTLEHDMATPVGLLLQPLQGRGKGCREWGISSNLSICPGLPLRHVSPPLTTVNVGG